MAKVVADISMSLDGFVTGPDPDLEHGLGHGGEPLHNWAIDSDSDSDVDVDAEVLREATEATGAVVLGRRLFDIVDGPHGWNDEMGYGAHHAGTPPMFVVTHHQPESVRLEQLFTIVTDGLEAAIDRARAAAGDKNAVVMGGGDVINQCVERRLVDELRIHLAPLVLGAGTRLFEGAPPTQLVQREVRVSPHATHVTYDLAG